MSAIMNISQYLLKKIYAPAYYKFNYRNSIIKSYVGLSQAFEDPIKISPNVEVSGTIKIGAYSSIMDYCHIGINTTSIGRYCSIARGCIIGPNIHPTNLMSTSASFYSKTWSDSGRNLKKTFNTDKKTEILNDVWIGANVIITSGVRIGNGAVIGAGSVVTKDVDDYAIVAGNPAKLIRYRFDANIIKSLLENKWWDIPHKELNKIWDLDIEKSIIKLIEYRKTDGNNY